MSALFGSFVFMGPSYSSKIFARMTSPLRLKRRLEYTPDVLFTSLQTEDPQADGFNQTDPGSALRVLRTLMAGQSKYRCNNCGLAPEV